MSNDRDEVGSKEVRLCLVTVLQGWITRFLEADGFLGLRGAVRGGAPDRRMQAPGAGTGQAPTLYQRLGVLPGAGHDEIKQAYRAAAIANHPDRGGGKEMFQGIQEAWDVLKDDAKRAAYDVKLSAAGAKTEEVVVASDLSLSDFEYDEYEGMYRAQCRCGDYYEVGEEELLETVVIQCGSCSLNVRLSCLGVSDSELDNVEAMLERELS